MAKLTDLPDELLLPIVAELNTRDLHSLSLVTRRLRAISQGELYYDVYISNAHIQLPLLIRTLVARTDLAPLVRSFQAPISKGYLTCPTTWDSIINKATKLKSTSRFNSSAWRIALHSAYLPACIGLVLALASRLEQLDISESSGPHISLESMFSMQKHDKGISFTSVRSLRSLVSLKLSVKDLDGRWCRLPKVRNLELDLTGPYAASRLEFDQCVSSVIENLTLRTTTEASFCGAM
jgi:hypothetical protein